MVKYEKLKKLEKLEKLEKVKWEKYDSNRRVKKWFNMVQNESKLVQNGPKELKKSNMVQYGLNLSKKLSK